MVRHGVAVVTRGAWHWRLGAAAALLACALVPLAAVSPSPAAAQQASLRIITGKAHAVDAANSGDTLLQSLESEHGELEGDRAATPYGAEFDLIVFPEAGYGVGLGFEYFELSQSLRLSDPAGVLPAGGTDYENRGWHYTLKFYGRTGWVLWMAGIGSGYYFVDYEDTTGPFVRQSTSNVWHARVGARVLLGDWSVLLEYGRVRAPLIIRERDDDPELELGGTFSTFGIGLSF